MDTNIDGNCPTRFCEPGVPPAGNANPAPSSIHLPMPVGLNSRKRRYEPKTGDQKPKRLRKVEGSVFREPQPYSIDFNTFNNPGIKDLRAFIQTLDKSAQWAVTRPQLIKKLQNQGSQSTLELLTLIAREPLAEDVITANNLTVLGKILEEQFSKPIFCSLGPGRVSWDIFWEFLQKNSQKMVDVYDYSITEEAKRTERRAIQTVIEHWMLPRDSRTALNCLDIENRIADCCPLPITSTDLLARTLQHGESTIGKTDSTWHDPHKEFFLLSTANALSPIHVDTAARLTYLYVLHGRKIIYFPRRIDSNSIRLLALVGSCHAGGYDGGWAKVELQAGDLFVMPPSCPHAVFTPDDCLVVGGHFYASAHLPWTLEGLRLQEENPQISNENLENKDYEVLSQIFNKFHEIGTPHEIERAWANCEVFLDSRSKPRLPEKRKDFIKALLEFSKRINEVYENEPE